MSNDRQRWYELRRNTPEKLVAARAVLDSIRSGVKVSDAIRRFPLKDGGYVGKHMLVNVYQQLVNSGQWVENPKIINQIRMKPVRTLSGVTTVTVLTKPYPCPGKCIFCPTDIRMPKSYLPDEPGARRGLEHQYDPFNQVKSRIEALEAVGHPTEKIELLILGGTWSAYRKDYQEWFIRRCFDALNGGETGTLEEAQKINETAFHRNVGLVVETRPDFVNPAELKRLRGYGVTKIQIGIQSLDDEILIKNQRGHTVEEALQAVKIDAAAGFKIVIHWMPNLLGATLVSDRDDFSRLWEGLCPDEIKIYPTQLLDNAELFDYWQRGEFRPYSTRELIDLIADIKPTIPRYCRVNRVIRDIPSTYVVDGNRRTSLRQDVQIEMKQRGTGCQCIRCREIKGGKINPDSLTLDHLIYTAGGAEEHFISYVTSEDKIAGFLRLSIPLPNGPDPKLDDLLNAAVIREVHIYGQSLPIGSEEDGAAQHIGLGKNLIRIAEEIARNKGFSWLAVISAVGTREYYRRIGFQQGVLYLRKGL